MKLRYFFSSIVFIVGCGGATASINPEVDSPKVEPTPQQTALGEPPGSNEEDVSTPDFLGKWHNASCGERKYRREINFIDTGKFTAVDEEAPCPKGENCALPGIVEWQGTWTQNDKTIPLNVIPKAKTKAPERLPLEFVILREDPISIGERDNHLICPYQKSE